MDLRRLGLLTVVCLAAAGCRRDPYMDAYFEMLNSEKRVLEDRLYELEYDYKQALKELEACRRDGKTADRPAREQPDEPIQPEDSGPVEEDDVDIEIPDIELPPGFESGHRLRPDAPSFRTASASRRPEPVEENRKRIRNDADLADAIIAALDQDVDHIAINPRVTGGARLDNRPGDDGITVLIEPRNRQGHFVASPGAVTIVLLDPALSGEEARVGRWEIDRTAAQKALRDGPLDRGMRFQLPWSGAQPQNDCLHLFVRFACEDGRTLETEQEIRVHPRGRIAQRWTPRATPLAERKVGRATMAAWRDIERGSEPTTVQAVAEEQIARSVASRPASGSKAGDDDNSQGGGRLWKPNR